MPCLGSKPASAACTRRDFCAAFAAPLAASSWPGFRGRGAGRPRGDGFPLVWSAERNLSWTAALPGYGQSSPVVWGGRVFLTSIEGPNRQTLAVLCLDVVSGELLWRRTFSPTQKIEAADTVSKAAPTPAVDDHGVYAFFETGELVALSHGGAERWRRSLTAEYGEFGGRHGVGSSPRLCRRGLLVLAAHDGPSYLLCVDTKTGENVWKTDRAKGVCWSTPSVCRHRGEEFALVSGGDRLDAYSLETGEPLWEMEGLVGALIPSPTPIDGGALIGSSQKGRSFAVGFPAPGRAEPTTLWQAEQAGAYFSSPLVHRGKAYFVNKAGVGFCLDAVTGKQLWVERLSGQNWASPLGVGERVYFFSVNGVTDVVAAGESFEKLAENSLPVDGGRIYGVAAVQGALLVRSGDKLFKLEQSA